MNEGLKRNLIQFISEYDIDETVYFRLPDEDEGRAGIVTGILFRFGGCVCYEVTWSNRVVSWHREHELEKKKPSSFTE